MTASLRLRLFGGAALWITAAVAVAGVAISLLLGASIDRASQAELSDRLNRLVAIIRVVDGDVRVSGTLPDVRYETPFSGLYWQVRDPQTGNVLGSRSLWDRQIDLGLPTDGSATHRTVAGPQQQVLSALGRRITIDGSAGASALEVIVAEDRARIDASVATFGRDLAIALTILAVALVAAAWAQVRIGLGPLDAIKRGIASIRDGTSERLPDTYPREVMPLADEVNALLETQESAIRFSRERAADLAHGLRTPLAVLSGLAQKLRETGNDGHADELEELGRQMSERINYQLRLAQLRVRQRGHGFLSSVSIVVDQTLSVLARSPEMESIRWDVDVPEDALVDMDERDLMELAGVVLDNAGKWARSVVTVNAVVSHATIDLVIEDDGPGLLETQYASLGRRGGRLDETVAGTGLGLSIAKEIVLLNGGQLAFGKARIGGLSVRLVLNRAGALPTAI